MQEIFTHKSSQRGYINHGWLKTFHTFSFGDFHDDKMMGFRSLRVMNEDVVASETGFGMHPHRNMEIITYILSGMLTHTDNLGNKEEITEGTFQIMSAGTGIFHSEFNYLKEDCHLLQIWIKPNQLGGIPYHQTLSVNHEEKWTLIASSKDYSDVTQSENSPFRIKQNMELYTINSGSLKSVILPKTEREFAWIQIAKGRVRINGNILEQGDAIAMKAVTMENLAMKNLNEVQKIDFFEPSKVLLFSLA